MVRRAVWMMAIVGLVACGGGQEKPPPEKKPEPTPAPKAAEPAPDPQEERARSLAERLDVGFDEVEQLFREKREPSHEPLVRLVGADQGPIWAGSSVEEMTGGAAEAWKLTERWLGGAPDKTFSFPALRLEVGLYSKPSTGEVQRGAGLLLFRVVTDEPVEGDEKLRQFEWAGAFVPDARADELLKGK